MNAAENAAPSPPPRTIAAIATAPGRGGIGVIRLSGTRLQSMAQALVGRLPEARRAHFARFCGAEPGEILDEGLIVYFPAPHSFTGEDVIELHAHGGPVVMQMLLGRCLDLGAQLAEPGEFSKRAFLNGKLDLVQAEAVADLIDAATVSAARSAVRSLSGAFSKEINALCDQLIELRALTEATLDFPEEEVDFLQTIDAAGRLAAIDERFQRVYQSARQGQRLQSGLYVVLVGEPNVGKSSLLNALAGDDLAIVTPVAGTTRDVVRGNLQIEGIPLHVIDTAGLRPTDDEIEKIGIERTWREIEKADVLVVLTDCTRPDKTAEPNLPSDLIDHLPAHLPRITVRNKIDLVGKTAARVEEQGQVFISLSAKHGDGIDFLKTELIRLAGGQPAEDTFIARERHLRALALAATHLDAAKNTLGQLELFADELRLAQLALSEITGEFTPDDLLGEIFSRFCIGK